LKLYDTSPVLLYQGNTLAYFRRLPLRLVNGATVSDYYGGSATLGVSARRPSRVFNLETLSVGRCHVLCCSHQAHCLWFTRESGFRTNYTTCVFQCRHFRYAMTGAAYHHQELRFVVHSPYTQDLQSQDIHTFYLSPL